MSPAKIGQYPLVQTLTRDQSYLALDGAGRQVVVKILDSDCLLRGKLHPNIQSRLNRVRELAHTGVANLHGVERDGAKAFVVWEFVAGDTLEQYSARLQTPEGLARLAREIILAVESLHLLGIVHGRIHARNIIIDELGGVHLTHVSPLLYDDPATDARDLAAMIADLAVQRGWGDSPLAGLGDESLTLPQLRARLSVGGGETQPAAPVDETHLAGRPRRRALLAAAATALLAALLAAGLYRLTRRVSPQIPAPPQAPPAALRE